MRYLKHALTACAATVLAGCATLDEASMSVSCMLTRVTGGADPRCADSGSVTSTGKTSPPTQAGASGSSRFDSLQAVLDQEIQKGRDAQILAKDAMRNLPAAQQAVSGPVRLLDVAISDSQSGQSRNMRTLDSVTIDLPFASKGSAPYTNAMEVIKNLANQLADNRGASNIIVTQSEADVNAKRVNTSTGLTKSPRGNPINVQKRVDRALPAGVERYTIQAGEIRGKL